MQHLRALSLCTQEGQPLRLHEMGERDLTVTMVINAIENPSSAMETKDIASVESIGGESSCGSWSGVESASHVLCPLWYAS